MGVTTIEWTDCSINPIRARKRGVTGTKGGYNSGIGHYCEKIAPECALCYASKAQARFAMPAFRGAGRRTTLNVLQDGVLPMGETEVFFDPSRLQEVLRRKKPTKWFWCDMTDMFGAWVPDAWIDQCFAVMALTPQHTHQVLTKRPQRMAEYLTALYTNPANRLFKHMWEWADKCPKSWGHIKEDETFDPQNNLSHVWVGTSCGTQKSADEFIPWLQKCPASIRFLSIEPMLSAVIPNLEGISWAIVGGESGPGARLCHVEWLRSIVNQCKAAGTKCFVKQGGSHLTASYYDDGIRDWYDSKGWDWPEAIDWNYRDGQPPLSSRIELTLKDSKGGDLEELPAELRVREMPVQP